MSTVHGRHLSCTVVVVSIEELGLSSSAHRRTVLYCLYSRRYKQYLTTLLYCCSVVLCSVVDSIKSSNTACTQAWWHHAERSPCLISALAGLHLVPHLGGEHRFCLWRLRRFEYSHVRIQQTVFIGLLLHFSYSHLETHEQGMYVLLVALCGTRTLNLVV